MENLAAFVLKKNIALDHSAPKNGYLCKCRLTSFQQGIKKRNVEIAQQMKKKGMSNSDISELTGLTNEEIESL